MSKAGPSQKETDDGEFFSKGDIKEKNIDLGWPTIFYKFEPKVYKHPELYFLQDLAYQTESWQQYVRVFLLISLVPIYISQHMVFNWSEFFFPFTNWTLIVTTISIYLSFSAHGDTRNFGDSAKLFTKSSVAKR